MNSPIVDSQSNSMLVLTYHAVFAERMDWEKQSPSDRWYSILKNHFQAQMEYLAKNGYATVLLREFLNGEFSAKSVVLTFDDGHESNFSVVLPVLKSLGLRAEFFITASNVGKPGFVTWGELDSLQSAGMSVQSHGLNHRALTDLGTDELRREFIESKEVLRSNLGTEVNYFAIPGGFADDRVYREGLAAGYEALCNSEPGIATAGPIIPRIAIMHSTTLSEFTDLCQRKLSSVNRMGAQRRLAKVAKKVIGLRRYETLKHIRLRLLR